MSLLAAIIRTNKLNKRKINSKQDPASLAQSVRRRDLIVYLLFYPDPF
jgi:hypothetical protein